MGLFLVCPAWVIGTIMCFPGCHFYFFSFDKLHRFSLFASYDLLLILFLLMQLWMVRSSLETKDELKVITLFHLIGLMLEIFKVHMGSWSYPDNGIFKVFEVLLYSRVLVYRCSVARFLREGVFTCT